MASLAPYRERIDCIDSQIIHLLGQRVSIAREVATYKQKEGIPMMQPDRLGQVFDRVKVEADKEGFSPELAERLYELITEEMCRVEDAIMSEVDPSQRVRR
jgi:chorismate mutase